jgi:hypothetical protein
MPPLANIAEKRERKNRRYPWERWFNQAEFVLVRGRDFDCRTDTMIQMLRNRAGSMRSRTGNTTYAWKVRLSISVLDEGRILRVRVRERIRA